jgi:hypothetical protein
MYCVSKVVLVGPWVFHVFVFRTWEIPAVIYVVGDARVFIGSLSSCFPCMAMLMTLDGGV